MDAPFRFEFIPPPAELRPYIITLFVFATELDSFQDALPAYSAHLISFGQGRARIQLDAGRSHESSEAFFLSPMQKAATFSMEGPARACGASLTALGWAALAGMPVDTFGHQMIAAEQVLGGDGAARLAAIGQAYAGNDLQKEDVAESLLDLIRASLSPPPQNHRDFIDATMAWLNSDHNPDFETLVVETGLSRRQVQRLSKRFFGMPPATLVKRYRALRAATLLAQPEADPDDVAQAVGAFFDQAHMIKDIRYFTGRTPKKLSANTPSVASDTLGQ